MDIERLKELKGITEQLYQDGNVPLTYCDDVLELINNAFAIDRDLKENDMEKLKKCPFCGGEAEVVLDDYGLCDEILVECLTCVAKTSTYDTEKEATEAWNRRIE